MDKSRRKTIYRGRRIDLAVDTLTAPDGTEIQREVVVHPGAVVIIPWLAGEKVCLIRNFRPTVQETLLELPAGTLEPDEDPDSSARRELAEETGYICGSLRRLLEFYPSPGVLTERMFLYVAEDLRAGTQNLDTDEQIEPVIVEWKQAVHLVLERSIRDAKTILGILLWDRVKETASYQSSAVST